MIVQNGKEQHKTRQTSCQKLKFSKSQPRLISGNVMAALSSNRSSKHVLDDGGSEIKVSFWMIQRKRFLKNCSSTERFVSKKTICHFSSATEQIGTAADIRFQLTSKHLVYKFHCQTLSLGHHCQHFGKFFLSHEITFPLSRLQGLIWWKQIQNLSNFKHVSIFSIHRTKCKGKQNKRK